MRADGLAGKGCWRDNVFVELLWKSVNYEEVYLHGYDTVSVARQALTKYFDFYNRHRPHSSLDGKTPDSTYFSLSKPPLAAGSSSRTRFTAISRISSSVFRSNVRPSRFMEYVKLIVGPSSLVVDFFGYASSNSKCNSV